MSLVAALLVSSALTVPTTNSRLAVRHSRLAPRCFMLDAGFAFLAEMAMRRSEKDVSDTSVPSPES